MFIFNALDIARQVLDSKHEAPVGSWKTLFLILHAPSVSD